MNSGLRNLFEPGSVALIGSSKIREKLGMTSPEMFKNVVYNMTKYFEGETHIIDIEGKQGAKTLDKLSHTPDLAVIMLPPNPTTKWVQIGAKKGIKAFVLLTGGFKNPQRKKLSDLKKKHQIRILGPGTVMGLINADNGLNTTFERDIMPPRGSIAIITQSGGVGACLLDLACSNRIGVSKFAFMGDKADIDDVDILHYLEKDPETKVICLYLEGIENGAEFIKITQKIVKQKPILVLKGGKTREAARRALSHTASIAGSDMIFDAALKKAEAIRVQDMEELLNAANALAKQPPLKGDNIAIVSNVGGPAILAADAVVNNGLKLAALSEKTKLAIERRYPGLEASNPIDLIADARKQRYTFVLNRVISDPNVDGVMIINMLKSTYFEPKDAIVAAELSRKYPEKPILDVTAGGEDFALVQKVLMKTNIPVYNLPEKAASVMRIIRLFGRTKENKFDSINPPNIHC